MVQRWSEIAVPRLPFPDPELLLAWLTQMMPSPLPINYLPHRGRSTGLEGSLDLGDSGAKI